MSDEDPTTIFEQCSGEFDAQEDLSGMLQCLSSKHEATTGSLGNGIDTFYLIFAGALVYFMQTGFAMLCAGSIRAKNVKNVILWNLLDSCGGGLAFWAVGYAFAYGGDDSDSTETTFVGNRGFFLTNDASIRFENWFFQFAFACALSSIVAGTIAERTQMKAYLLYSVFLVGFVYPVVAHAFWSTHGFLSAGHADPFLGSGVIDLAGSGAVHMTGGVTALAAAIILGPRIGRFHDKDGNPLEEPNDFPPHSVTLQFLGTFCLWFGWYGFNPGSVFYISSTENGAVAALVAVNTTLGACAGAISAMFTSTFLDYYYLGYHTYDLGYTMNGCLTGLVAITAGCATVDTWAAVVIGIIAGWVYLGISKTIVRLRIDDAVDAIPVHMGGGMWGILAAGLFSKPSLLSAAYNNDSNPGWFYQGNDFTLAGIQIVAIIFVFGWTFCVMGSYFYFLNYMGWLRIDPLEEEVGMDISRHKGSCYDMQTGVAHEDDVKQLEAHRSELFEDRSASRSRHKGNRNATTNEATKNDGSAVAEEKILEPSPEKEELPAEEVDASV